MFARMLEIFSRSLWAIELQDGDVQTRGAKLTPRFQNDVAELLLRYEVKNGRICGLKSGGLEFSSEIPKELHQQIRNIASEYGCI